MSKGQDRLRRLRWQSRRGMKELDVLLEAFFARENHAIQEGAWPQLESLLEQEDDIFFDWVSGRNLPDDQALLDLIREIKSDS